MKKFFTILAIFGIYATPMMRAQGFPSDPGTLMLDVNLAAETTTGDTLQMTLTGAGSYAYGTEVTIVAPERPGYQFFQWSDQNENSSRTFTLTESVSLTAIYEHLEYTIKFVDADGVLLMELNNYYGDILDTTELNPYHEYTDQYTFNFVKWTPSVTPVTASQTYYAVYDTITNKYEIRFLDDEENVLQDDTLEYGAMPAYRGGTPTKPTVDGMKYTFSGWEPEIEAVTGEADYMATFSEEMIQVNVTIIIDSDTSHQTVDWGTEVELVAPEKTGYTFTGWSNGLMENPLNVTVTSDTVFIASYEINHYEIRFIINYGDSTRVLEIDTVPYGTMPQYTGETPTRPTADGVVYTFIGWEPTIAEATEDVTYMAKFTDEMLQFNVITIIQNDTIPQTVDWGTQVTFNADEKEGYTFIKWSNDVTANPMYITIVQDTVITAIYERNFYEIRFLDWDENVLEVDTIEHGVMPQFTGETPTRETAMGVKYTFTGWEPTIAVATADADYTAVYSSEDIIYTAYIVCGKDTIPQTGTYATQLSVVASVIEGQHFISWTDGNTDNPRIIVLVSDTTLTAVYGDSYFSIPVAANAWTFFSLPMTTEATYTYNADIIDDSELANVSWGTYNGAVRAAAQSGWENTDASALDAAHGYIVYSTAEGALKINMYTENLQTERASVAVYQYEAVHEQNANWNFIGNPLYREINASEINANGSDASITIWNGTGYSNVMIGPNGEETIQPMQAFFFQPTAEVNALTFGQQNGNPAPARSAIEENSRIDIQATAGGYTDRTRVIFRANSSLKYEAGRDASKFLTTTAPVQLYFIDVDNVQCAQMVRPAGDDNMRLGFTLYQAGDITINMPVFAGDYDLYDALTGRSYDLNEEFTIYSEAGTYNNRLELRPVERAYTNLDNTDVQNFVVTNKGIYVVGNAPVSVYTILGQHLCTQTAQGLLMLQNGTFVVVSGEQAAKVTIQ